MIICRHRRIRAICEPQPSSIRIPCRSSAAAHFSPPAAALLATPAIVSARLIVTWTSSLSAPAPPASPPRAASPPPAQRFVVFEAADACRRPLRHRHADLRRAVRPRRALDSPGRRQSAAQAGAAARLRGLSGAARAVAACGSARMRATANWRISSPAWCARTAPSAKPPAAKATWRRRSALPNDLGEWRTTIDFVLGPYRLRQGSDRGLGRRFRASAGTQFRCLLPAGLWRAAGAVRGRTCRYGCRCRSDASPTVTVSASMPARGASRRAP